MIRLETRTYKTPHGRRRGYQSLADSGFDYFEFHSSQKGFALAYAKTHGAEVPLMSSIDAMKPTERIIEHAIMTGPPRYCQSCNKLVARRVIRLTYPKELSEKTLRMKWMRFSLKLCKKCASRVMDHEEQHGR